MYQLIKSIELDPDFDGTNETIEVSMLWGDSILQVHHLKPNESFVLTNKDFPEELLGSTSVTIVDAGVFKPRYDFGHISVRVKSTKSAKPLPKARKRDRRLLGTLIGSTMAMIAAIGTMNFAVAEDTSLLSMNNSEDRLAELRSYMARQAVREPQVIPTQEDTHRVSNQTVDSSRGHSERVSNRGARVITNRIPNPTYRMTPRQQVAGSGIFAALQGQAMISGASGIVTPFGNMTDTTTDTVSASDGIGNEFGVMGGVHTGWGGGPSGEGTINIGTLNTIGGASNGHRIGLHQGESLSNRNTHGPIVRTRAPEITGLLPQEAIRRVVVRNIGQINHCYEQGLASNPELTGRVVVRFVIGGTGTVMGSTITDSSLGLRTVEECIMGAVRRWQFPAPEGAGVVTVNYPFNLQIN